MKYSTFVLSLALSLLLGVAAAACGDSTPLSDVGADAGAAAPSDAAAVNTEGAPCEVAEILSEHCWACHTDPPRNAAPMPLMTRADFQRPSVSMPDQPVWQRVMARIHDAESPMPPPSSSTLDDATLATLDTWLEDGAPARTAGERCDDVAPPPVPRGDELPCTPTHSFLAHDATDSSAPFDVPVSADNLYECFTFRSPFGADEQATAWAPVVDDTRVLHHWILYRTQTEQVDGGVGRCNMPLDATFLMGWAPGGGVEVMPDDVGVELRTAADEWLILQVHYWNVPGYTDARDRSGVSICTTDTPRENTAGVLTMGALGIFLPPRSRDVQAAGNCSTGSFDEPIHVLSSGPHMHELGTAFTTEIERRGGSTEMLVAVDPWDFNAQTTYWHRPAVRIDPGDTLRTTCTYDNMTDSLVTFGEDTEDEMCFNFALVYPIGAVGGQRLCLF